MVDIVFNKSVIILAFSSGCIQDHVRRKAVILRVFVEVCCVINISSNEAFSPCAIFFVMLKEQLVLYFLLNCKAFSVVVELQKLYKNLAT